MNIHTLRAFVEKVAYVAKTPAMKVELHHRADDKDWAQFEKNLRAKKFQQAAIQSPKSDEKLRRYVENFGGYVSSKKVVGAVPSRTSSKVYKIKELPGGRLGCNCKDWQYKHSHSGTDCDHIDELKQGMTKSSSALKAIARGIAYERTLDKMKEQAHRGKLINENVRRLGTGEPLHYFHHTEKPKLHKVLDTVSALATIGH